MAAQRDRILIGRLVEREVESTTTWSQFAVKANVSRATLYRVKDGDDRVTDQTYRRIERALGLPYDSLASVGGHDFDVLITQGMDRGLVEWLRKIATESSPARTAPLTSKTRGRRVTEPVSDEG